MRKTIFLGLVAASLAAPVSAYAQPTVPSVAVVTSDQLIVIRPAQWIAMGVGFVAGAVVVNAIVPGGRLGYIAGGLLGGYLANIWYTGHQLEIHVGTIPKT